MAFCGFRAQARLGVGWGLRRGLNPVLSVSITWKIVYRIIKQSAIEPWVENDIVFYSSMVLGNL